MQKIKEISKLTYTNTEYYEILTSMIILKAYMLLTL